MIETASPPARRSRCFAIAGNPNSGKTTLFNALTGLRHKVANYPGVTVEKREGALRGGGGAAVTLLDLPGTYSLSARSPDEQIPRDVLLGRLADTPRPDGVLIVLDGSNLERNLYLACQVLELRLPAVVACNMADRAEAAGTPVDLAALSAELGVPVAATVGHQGRGLAEVKRLLSGGEAVAAPARRWRLPEAVERVVGELAELLVHAAGVPAESADGAAILLLTDEASGGGDDGVGGDLPEAVVRHLRQSIAALGKAGFDDVAGLIVEARYTWISEIAGRVIRRRPGAGRIVAMSDRIDRVVTHRVWGLAVFGAVMLAMFVSIFWCAEPLMRGIEAGQNWMAEVVRGRMTAGPLRDLLADGVIGGMGSVVTFFPQICILFLFIAVLEDSGYMARAAFLMDKLMSRVGLAGKSFIPLLSSFACAIPGIMATRTIENRRDRFTTILVAPLMSCSARLPVYLVIIAAVFGERIWLKAGVIFGMYVLGIVTAMAMATLFKRTLLRGPRPTFIMELPPYHLPRPWAVMRTMWDRSRQFLTRAGTTILAICIVLWALAYFPRSGGSSEFRVPSSESKVPSNNEAAARQLEQSYLGRMGRAMQPVFEPLGFDWKIGVGVLASFAAREVFVGTMGTIYSVGNANEHSTALRERMRDERWGSGAVRGRPVYTVATGLALMVFYVLCCQCVSTLAVVRRETNSWRWPAFMFAYMTALAYVGALATHRAAAWAGGG